MKPVDISKSFLGYVWVALAITASILGFKDMEKYEQLLVQKSGLHVSENWQGGRIDSIKEHGDYQTLVHQPVFAGLFSKAKNGFIQIDWTGSGNLPHYITEEFDYDHDRGIDFSIQLNTLRNTASLKSYSDRAISIADHEVLVFGTARTIRVNIKK